MKQPDKTPLLVSAEGPINRRTALLAQRQREAAQAEQNPTTPPELLERMHRNHLRHTLGAPLAQQWAALEKAEAKTAPSGLLIGAGVLTACGAVVGLLGTIQASAATLGLGFALGLVGLLGLAWVRRQARHSTHTTTAAPPLFDTETLEAFDRVLDSASAELGDEARRLLLDIKHALVSMALHARGVDEHFTAEDRLYLRECLRRYVPDTLQAFLRVPPAQRTTLVLESQTTAQAVLLRQLTSLRDEIAQREKKMGRSAAEGLMQQDRFLASKRSR